MSKLTGSVLILAGIGVAAYALYPELKAAGTLIAAAPAGYTATMPASAAAGGAPAAAREPAHSAGVAMLRSAPHTAGSEPPAARAAPPAQIVHPAPVPARRLQVKAAAVRVDEAPPRVPVGASKAAEANPLDPAALARHIQRELKRIGCYDGDVTGVWSRSVRQAMRAFTERANASLPVDKPDPVLLAMVQDQKPGACSAACPSGQDLGADGRCVPSALVAAAGADKKHSGSKSGRAAAPAAADRPPEGRMSLAGPPAARQDKAAKRPRVRPRRAVRAKTWRGRSAQRQRSSGPPLWALPFLRP